MIDKAYVMTMAAYNRWQNDNLYSAAGTLDDVGRKAERGAFFGSIHATLNHLLWADQVWMSRFTDLPRPRARSIAESVRLYASWQDLSQARIDFDRVILDWASALDPEWLKGSCTYFSAAVNRELERPWWLLVTHMFNHQTHHRGQVHAMLTSAGARPGDTDLPFMPDAMKGA